MYCITFAITLVNVILDHVIALKKLLCFEMDHMHKRLIFYLREKKVIP